MWQFISSHHPMLWGMGLMWIIGNIASTMPTPRDNSSIAYEWVFKFFQPIGAAIPRVLAVYAPSWFATVTGQQPKPTIPPNPPIAAGEVPATKPTEVPKP